MEPYQSDKPKNVFTILELNKTIVAACPKTALKKAVRKIVHQIKSTKKNIFDMKDMHITLADSNGKKHAYIISIVKTDEVPSSVYYKLDYGIEIYKKQANI